MDSWKFASQNKIMKANKSIWLRPVLLGWVTVNTKKVVFRKASNRAQPRGRFGRNSLPKLADFSLFSAEGEVKMYRTCRQIQNLDQNFSLK